MYSILASQVILSLLYTSLCLLLICSYGYVHTQERAHVPWLILVYKYFELWKADPARGGAESAFAALASNYKLRKQFLEFIREGRRFNPCPGFSLPQSTTTWTPPPNFNSHVLVQERAWRRAAWIAWTWLPWNRLVAQAVSRRVPRRPLPVASRPPRRTPHLTRCSTWRVGWMWTPNRANCS